MNHLIVHSYTLLLPPAHYSCQQITPSHGTASLIVNSMSSANRGLYLRPGLLFSPDHIDSLDARALQYKYAIVKLTLFITAIDGILKESDTEFTAEPQSRIVLVHYILYCVTNLFSINENGFAPKLKLIESFRVPKSSTIPISSTLTHVPYDGKDLPVPVLTDLPPAGKSVLCLKALRNFCCNCLEGYQKRYSNVYREIENSNFCKDIEFLFENKLFSTKRDLDLSLASESLPIRPLVLSIDPSLVKDSDYVEATLIDMDLNALFTFVYNISATLADLSGPIEEMRAVKLAPKARQEAIFRKLPESSYALHKLLFWAMRLNDLYLVSRKFIRQIYHSNLEHLTDRKFLSFVSKVSIFQNLLTDINEVNTTAKKNGVLVATITRLVRSNSWHEVSAITCVEFIGFISQFLLYMESLLARLKKFGEIWIAAEMAFRTEFGLYTDTLSDIEQAIQRTPKTELQIMRYNQAQAKAKEKEDAQILRHKMSLLRTKPTLSVSKTSAPATKKGKSQGDLKSSETDSLSSRVSSLYSSMEEGSASFPSYSMEATSEIPEKPLRQLYIHRTSSTSSLPANRISTQADAGTSLRSRARSSSLPLSFSTAYLARQNEIDKDEGTEEKANVAKPKGLRLSSLTSADAERPHRPKLTVSQKFQQQVQQASKAGHLLTKEKEVYTSVVFDPNNPSATNLRRSSRSLPKSPEVSMHPSTSQEIPRSSLTLSTQSSAALLSSFAAATASSRSSKEREIESIGTNNRSRSPISPKAMQSDIEATVGRTHLGESRTASKIPTLQAPSSKPSRAQITKQNTQRNSVVIQTGPLSTSPSIIEFYDSSSERSTCANKKPLLPTKRVRFTGIPEWTPAEDAQTEYSKSILKNFPSLKYSPIGLAAFKQKDLILKKEESLSFRSHTFPDE